MFLDTFFGGREWQPSAANAIRASSRTTVFATGHDGSRSIARCGRPPPPRWKPVAPGTTRRAIRDGPPASRFAPSSPNAVNHRARHPETRSRIVSPSTCQRRRSSPPFSRVSPWCSSHRVSIFRRVGSWGCSRRSSPTIRCSSTDKCTRNHAILGLHSSMNRSSYALPLAKPAMIYQNLVIRTRTVHFTPAAWYIGHALADACRPIRADPPEVGQAADFLRRWSPGRVVPPRWHCLPPSLVDLRVPCGRIDPCQGHVA